MGQYHFVANMDKREFLHPHRFGDGLKLMEFGGSGGGTMLGLAVLLACSNDRGGGDLHVDESTTVGEAIAKHVVGRWAGDQIAIIGDYASDGDFEYRDKQFGTLTSFRADDGPWADDTAWVDISGPVLEALKQDAYHEDRPAWSSGSGKQAILTPDGLEVVEIEEREFELDKSDE
jgi:hypothetical protein